MSELQQPVIIKSTSSYIVVNKPAGWLSQKGRNNDTSIFEYFNKKNKGKIHLLNRVDRPVSGLILLSKTRAFTKAYLESQENNNTIKTYLAVVEGKVDVESDTLEQWLVHDKQQMKTSVTDENNKNAKKCILSFNRLGLFDNYSLLEVVITKGKFHQIRAQLASYGHPIKGDVKYGARRGNRDRSIHLHSFRIDVQSTEVEKLSFTAPIWKKDSLWEAAGGILNQKP